MTEYDYSPGAYAAFQRKQQITDPHSSPPPCLVPFAFVPRPALGHAYAPPALPAVALATAFSRRQQGAAPFAHAWYSVRSRRRRDPARLRLPSIRLSLAQPESALPFALASSPQQPSEQQRRPWERSHRSGTTTYVVSPTQAPMYSPPPQYTSAYVVVPRDRRCRSSIRNQSRIPPSIKIAAGDCCTLASAVGGSGYFRYLYLAAPRSTVSVYHPVRDLDAAAAGGQ
ncbi:hypothetical protein DFH06DRAFT_1348883 [Mycena polygramma]|nr:hypothetical protein DFH06DRAFT_1348883 [Mycena polygramma]